MKRFWIGICILAILLVSGWISTAAIERCYTPISRDLAMASQAALAGDRALAVQLSENAAAQWQRCRDFTAAFADHRVLEEMESLFAKVEAYRQADAPLSFAAACAHLSRLADAVAQSHLPKWQNFL